MFGYGKLGIHYTVEEKSKWLYHE